MSDRALVSKVEIEAHKLADLGGRFDGKVALITGASDRGIGGEIAVRLAREGAAVAMISRREPGRLLKKLSRFPGGAVHTLGDVTKGDDIERAIEACVDEFGKIDVLVNNAGVEAASPLEAASDDQWRALLEVNLSGAIAVTKAALPVMVQPGSAIINIASALGIGGCAGFSVYSASKAGLIGFTQSLAWELAPQGIRVVALAPGLVHTPMVHKHVEKLTPDVWRQIEACHPLGMGRPADVAAAVAFLASDEARWITGVTLPLGWAPHYPLPSGALMA
ncbi:MAG TPA: SDR family oxidoreductase [Pirellulaceae bacterium]|nr:SDR family oxidoreductase [Pirellulaceae bacterium]